MSELWYIGACTITFSADFADVDFGASSCHTTDRIRTMNPVRYDSLETGGEAFFARGLASLFMFIGSRVAY